MPEECQEGLGKVRPPEPKLARYPRAPTTSVSKVVEMGVRRV